MLGHACAFELLSEPNHRCGGRNQRRLGNRYCHHDWVRRRRGGPGSILGPPGLWPPRRDVITRVDCRGLVCLQALGPRPSSPPRLLGSSALQEFNSAALGFRRAGRLASLCCWSVRLSECPEDDGAADAGGNFRTEDNGPSCGRLSHTFSLGHRYPHHKLDHDPLRKLSLTFLTRSETEGQS